MPQRSLARTVGFYAIALAFGGILALGAGELLVRWWIPEQTFWLLYNDLYRALDGAIGYTFKPHLHRIAFGVILDTNSLGFRGPEWRRDKPAGAYRIALIGDSHAFAFGVPFADSVGEVLGGRLSGDSGQRVEVLNFGVNGYNSQQELAVLTTVALDFAPDLVIVIASSNDDEPPPFVDAQGWLHHHAPKPGNKRPSSGLTSLQQRSRLALYLRLLRERRKFAHTLLSPPDDPTLDGDWMAPFPPGPVSDRLRDTVYQPLKAMIAATRRRGIPIIIANFNAFLDYRQMFEVLAQEEKIPTLELLALFPEAKNWRELQRRFSLGWDSHLNAEAHRRWARALAELIEEQGYLRHQ